MKDSHTRKASSFMIQLCAQESFASSPMTNEAARVRLPFSELFAYEQAMTKRLILAFLALCFIARGANCAEQVNQPPSKLEVPAAAVQVTDPAAADRAWLDTVP